MNLPVALAVDLPSAPKLSRADLLRLEGLGDNCELGFVLRRLGFEDGMLFRWASVKPESVLATLRGDFRALYEFENLVPRNSKMVRDLHYGTCWHSQMHSSLREGVLTFDADEATRRPIHAKEASKLAYLTGKLRTKFQHPNPVFVIKANDGISAQTLEAIHYQLYRRVASPRFLLLEVRDDPRRAGSVELIDRNLMRGYVTGFASYDRADEGDDVNWLKVLDQALAHYADAAPASEASSPGQRQGVLLPFPLGTDASSPVPGDLRGGVCTLIRGNGWCRVVDDGAYRLHATGMRPEATALQWTGVHLPPGFRVRLQAACAIVDSVPVHAVLEATAADGTTFQSEQVFAGIDEHRLQLPILPPGLNPLTLTLSVEPVTPLRNGQAAVIDISMMEAGAAS